MAQPETKALRILGGRALLRPKRNRLQSLGRVRARTGQNPRIEPGDLAWAGLIRSGLPARSTQNLAVTLHISVADLAKSLRLPGRTVHRRLARGELLPPEESERNVRAARLLAKAQALLGDENGRGWVLSPCRALGGEVPITLLDTADGFTAAMDELGRLEYGVLS